MPSRNKQRGNELERQVVNMAKDLGLKAERAWGSNGKALGLDETVDVLISDFLKIQCKRKKEKFPQWMLYDEVTSRENYDAVVFKQDRSRPVILMDLEVFLRIAHQTCRDQERNK